MKKIILSAGIIITLITSCSTDDLENYHNETNEKRSQIDTNENAHRARRDSVSRDSMYIDPIKPDKPR